MWYVIAGQKEAVFDYEPTPDEARAKLGVDRFTYIQIRPMIKLKEAHEAVWNPTTRRYE
jgi:hypothetical protein